MHIYAERTSSPIYTSLIINKARFADLTNEEIVYFMDIVRSVIHAHDFAYEPDSIAIYLPLEAIPGMKELCMFADRTSATPAIKQLAWGLFTALDTLTKNDGKF